MTKSITLMAATSMLALLAACDSSSSGSTSSPNSHETLSSDADTTSTLGGVAFRSNGTTGATEVLRTSGTTKHDTGNTTITDGTYSLTDADGFDSNGVLTDGSSTLESDDNQGIAGTYEYVTAYGQTYTHEGTTYDSVGIGGIITKEASVPTSGTASYTGGAAGVIQTGTQGFDLENGSSTVNADFGAGTVDVTMSGFTARDQTTGNTATAPIDTISATGMTISGNRFNGGTVTTSNNGATTAITGANPTSSAEGAFFGYDSAHSVPDEVGGVVLQQGADGSLVAGGFLAD